MGTLLDAIIAGDTFIDYPFEEVKFRWQKASGKVFRRFYGEKEAEVEANDALYKDAIRAGKQITEEEYQRDR